MKLKNINGTSQTTCVCGSWLRHWEKFSNQSITFCPVRSPNCLNEDLMGAHVQKADSSDNKWYIFPLCSAHNQKTSILGVSDSLRLVSANKSETCEK